MNTKRNSGYVKALALFCVTLLFSVLTYFVDRQPVGVEGTSVGFATLNSAFSRAFQYNSLMDTISDIVMYLAFLVVLFFAGIGVIQLVKGKSLSKVSKAVIGLGILYIVVIVLYVLFGKIPINYRPIIPPGETEIETSFPSTHTMVICTVFGSAIVALKNLLSDKKKVRMIAIIAIVLMAVGVLARLFAGVHWLTDIFAGILFSGTLIALYAAWIVD